MKKLALLLFLLLSAAFSIAQTCENGIIALPYSEGFENGALNCWTAYDVDNNEDNTPTFTVTNTSRTTWCGSEQISVPFAHTGSYACVGNLTQWGYPSSYITQSLLVSEKIHLNAGKTGRISFYSNSWSSGNKLSVLVFNENGNFVDKVNTGTGFTRIWGEQRFYYDPNLCVQQWQFVELNLQQYAGQEIYIAFYYNGDTNGGHGFWVLDDINIWELENTDAGVTEIVSPSTAADLSASEQVTVKIKNFGQQPLVNIPVTLTLDGQTLATETVSATLVSYEEISYTFQQTVDLSAAQTYTISASTGAEGDSNAANNSASKQLRNYGHFEIGHFPHHEGFEYDTTLVFWKQQIEEQYTSPIHWIYAAGSAAWNSSNIKTAHSGARNAQLTAFNMSFEESMKRYRTKLVTPRIHLATIASPIVKFWHAQPSDYGDLFHLDTLKIYYKTSVQENWRLLYTETRTLNEWTETVLALPNKTNDYYLAFEGTLNTGWDVILDEVSILESAEQDARMVEIIKPQTGFDMANENVSVRVENFGGQPLTDIPVKFSVNGNIVGNEIIHGTLAPQADTVYTFITQADLSLENQYIITAFVDLSDDSNRTNDSISITINNYVGKVVMGLFDSIATCNTEFYDNGVENAYHGGSSYLGYAEKTTLYPSTAGNRIKAAFENYDLATPDYSQGFRYDGDTLYIYDGANAMPDMLLGCLTGSSANAVSLPAFESSTSDGALTFVFHKLSSSSVRAQGWKANIICFEPNVSDVGVREIVAPAKAGNVSAQIRVKIQNYGSAPQSNFPVTLNMTVDGGGYANIISETFTGTLNAGEIAEFTFAQTVDMSAISENIEITACTALEGDVNQANNCQSKHYISRPNVALSGFRLYDRQNQINFGGSTPAEYRNQTYRFVSFNSNEIESLTVHNAFDFSANGFIAAGAYARDTVFAYTVMQDATPAKYLILDRNYNILHSNSFSGNMGIYPNAEPWCPDDITYDYSTNSLLGVVVERVQSVILPYLAKFSVSDGSLVAYVSLTQRLTCIAADKDGNLYGIGSDGQGEAYFASITLQQGIGVVNIISHTGVILSGKQSMTFDHRTNRLFWAVSANTFENLYEINPGTGAIHDFGRIGSGAEIVALYTPYDAPTEARNPLFSEMQIYAHSRTLFFKNLPENSNIRIVDVSGRIVQSFINDCKDGERALFALQAGVYVVEVRNKDGKTAKKLIIEN